MSTKATILYRGLFGPSSLLIIQAFEFHPRVDNQGAPIDGSLHTKEKDHFYNLDPASMTIDEIGLDGMSILPYQLGKVIELSPLAQDAAIYQKQTHIVWTETQASISIIHENWKAMT